MKKRNMEVAMHFCEPENGERVVKMPEALRVRKSLPRRSWLGTKRAMYSLNL